jgi:twitching motility protein PilT
MDNNQSQVSGQNLVNDDSVNNQVVATPNDQDMPSTLNQDNEGVNAIESTVNEVQVEKEEKKESPLEALASKLAALKSELIQEVPDTPSTSVDAETKVEDVPRLNTDAVSESLGTQETYNKQKELEHQDTNPIQPISMAPQVDDVNSQEQVSEATSIDETPVSEVNLDTTTEQEDITQIQEQINSDVNSEINKEIGTGDVLQTSSLEQQFPDPVMTHSIDDNTQKEQTLDLLSQPTLDTPVMDIPVTQEIGLDSQQEVISNEQKEQTPQLDSGIEPDEPKPDTPSVDDILAQYEVSSSDEVANKEDTSTSNIKTEELPKVDDSNENPKSTHQDYQLDIRKILDIAIERNASDILISVGYPVMIRVDGSLVAVHEQLVAPKNAEELIFPVLSEQKKELLEVNREVDLAYTHQHNGEARFRINAFYTRENLAAAFRLIPTKIKTIEELNLPPIYNQLANLKQGLVLVTGPTGHGKSTTLAAILQAVNTNRSVHLLTIEDPIEYIFPKAKAVVDQREMHDDTHSWTVALKSAMRQNPDVILVGEMRDFETISAAITLAETGHLVFATLHTNSATQTIDRIIDVFPENQQAQIRTQLATILEAVIAQRLIPIDGGGRRAVSEIMIGTPAIRNLIREGKAHQMDNVIRTSSDVGMISLESSLVKLVREGLITMDKAQEYAVHPEEVVRLLKG